MQDLLLFSPHIIATLGVVSFVASAISGVLGMIGGILLVVVGAFFYTFT